MHRSEGRDTLPDAARADCQPFTSQAARGRFFAPLEVLEQSWPVELEACTARTENGETFVWVARPPAAPPVVLLPGAQSSSLVWRHLIKPLHGTSAYALDAVHDEGRSQTTYYPATDDRALV
jgi:hypothetical protein